MGNEGHFTGSAERDEGEAGEMSWERRGRAKNQARVGRGRLFSPLTVDPEPALPLTHRFP